MARSASEPIKKKAAAVRKPKRSEVERAISHAFTGKERRLDAFGLMPIHRIERTDGETHLYYDTKQPRWLKFDVRWTAAKPEAALLKDGPNPDFDRAKLKKWRAIEPLINQRIAEFDKKINFWRKFVQGGGVAAGIGLASDAVNEFTDLLPEGKIKTGVQAVGTVTGIGGLTIATGAQVRKDKLKTLRKTAYNLQNEMEKRWDDAQQALLREKDLELKQAREMEREAARETAIEEYDRGMLDPTKLKKREEERLVRALLKLSAGLEHEKDPEFELWARKYFETLTEEADGRTTSEFKRLGDHLPRVERILKAYLSHPERGQLRIAATDIMDELHAEKRIKLLREAEQRRASGEPKSLVKRETKERMGEIDHEAAIWRLKPSAPAELPIQDTMLRRLFDFEFTKPRQAYKAAVFVTRVERLLKEKHKDMDSLIREAKTAEDDWQRAKDEAERVRDSAGKTAKN